MVQIILARRVAAMAISADKSPETRSGFPGFKVSPFFVCCVVAGDSPASPEPGQRGRVDRDHIKNGYGFLRCAFDSISSIPSRARGNSMALNSAPTSTTSEIMYIHTSNAMPTPSEP